MVAGLAIAHGRVGQVDLQAWDSWTKGSTRNMDAAAHCLKVLRDDAETPPPADDNPPPPVGPLEAAPQPPADDDPAPPAAQQQADPQPPADDNPPQVLTREQTILNAVRALDPDDADLWTRAGNPKVAAIRQATGLNDVTAAEVTAAWNAVKQESAADG